jgi:hypothetical protein
MRARQLACILLLLGVAGTAFAAADTVMIYVEAAPVNNSTITPPVANDAATLRSAVEEGIMDEFFSAGHIVFNELPPKDADHSSQASQLELWNSLQQVALSGGAARMIEVFFTYKPNETGKSAVPIAARYSLWELSPKRLVSSGDVSAAPIAAAARNGDGEVSLLLGQTIATDLLNSW